MFVSGPVRVGKNGFKRVDFPDGNFLVQGMVFGLSDRGSSVMCKLVVRGEDGEKLIGCAANTLLHAEGELLQESFPGTSGDKVYITVIEAFKLRSLAPQVSL